MIYFVQPVAGGRIKIGRTVCLTKRLKQLCAQHGLALRVLAVLSGGALEESRLHRRFAHLRTRGNPLGREWFEPGQDLLSYIAHGGSPWDGSDEVVVFKPSRMCLNTDRLFHLALKQEALRRGMTVSALVEEILKGSIPPIPAKAVEEARKALASRKPKSE